MRWNGRCGDEMGPMAPKPAPRDARARNPVASNYRTDRGATMPILKTVLAALACVLLLGGCDTKPEPTKPKLATEASR